MPNKAVQQLRDLVLSGTEEQVREYVNSHWDEFPQEVQDHMSAALFIDALREDTRKETQFADFQERLIKAIETIVSSK
ncbi:hypothetical protein HY968_03945 [Candidatus Kaiserbacteria bacterium]|nr:hypothetical protein [Candidatus Kaiserbacteria bacterium]